MLFHTIDQVRRFFKILGGLRFWGWERLCYSHRGPAGSVIFLGLTLLAAEFVWARRLMDRMRQQGTRWKDSVLRVRKSDPADSA